MFSAIYVLNLCRRIVELLLKKKQA
jgi:hypothetical protein